METTRTNWLALAASTVASMALGFLWYGVLFLKQWAAGNGITFDETQTKAFKNGVEMSGEMGSQMGFNALSIAVSAFIVNWLVGKTGMTTWAGGAQVGLMIGLISCFGIFTGNMFAGNPTSLSMVDGSYSLVMFIIIGAIMGGWRKRG